MTIYKIGWTIIDGVDENICGTDRMWFDEEPGESEVLSQFDNFVGMELRIAEKIAHNFYWAYLESTAPEDFKIWYIKEDRFRRGDIALVAGRTRIRIYQVRGKIVIGRTFGIANSESHYFLRDLVLVEARRRK